MKNSFIKMIDKIVQETENSWWASYDLKENNFSQKIDGWFFCLSPEKSKITNKLEFRNELENFVKQNEKILLEKNIFLWTWKDENAYYIDITTFEKNIQDAIKKVERLWSNQISIYNPGLDKTYYLN